MRDSSPYADQIRQRREALGLSREELAEKASISASTVKNLEIGRHTPTRTKLGALLAALGMPALDPAPPRAMLSATDPQVLAELLGRYSMPLLVQALRQSKIDLWRLFSELFPTASAAAQVVARVDAAALVAELGSRVHP